MLQKCNLHGLTHVTLSIIDRAGKLEIPIAFTEGRCMLVNECVRILSFMAPRYALFYGARFAVLAA